MSRNFLFISYNGVSVDLAWQIAKEGNSVKYYIKMPGEKDVGSGFVEHVDDWHEHVDWADMILFDEVGMAGEAAKLRAAGKAVIGSTQYTDRLEDDRVFGQDELKKAGVGIIPHKGFDDFDMAIDYVQKNPDSYVIKPSGEIQCMKDLLFVGNENTGRDILQVLNDYKSSSSFEIGSFQLQKKVTGVEIAVGAFFNGKEFIYPINVNFEHKKLFPGDLGPSTGEMGTTMFWSGPNVLFNATLKKMESGLALADYKGYVDINCIVNGNGIYPLEWTARFGYPTISIQQHSMISPIGEFLHELAFGGRPKLRVKSGFHIGIRVVVPPFPFEDTETFDVKSRDSLVYFKNGAAKNKEGFHIEDVKLINDEWVVAGNCGLCLVVCGSGLTMKQAQAQAYSRIKSIIIPNMYYRTDIGNRWASDCDKLQAWGYLRET